jgi:hypothetical protein
MDGQLPKPAIHLEKQPPSNIQQLYSGVVDESLGVVFPAPFFYKQKVRPFDFHQISLLVASLCDLFLSLKTFSVYFIQIALPSIHCQRDSSTASSLQANIFQIPRTK